MNRYNNMDFTIWVTRRCNLSCKYCYEGNNKLAASMDIKTADKTIEFICKTIKKVDENINVIFHGGGLMSIFWTQKVKLFYAALLANNSH